MLQYNSVPNPCCSMTVLSPCCSLTVYSTHSSVQQCAQPMLQYNSVPNPCCSITVLSPCCSLTVYSTHSAVQQCAQPMLQYNSVLSSCCTIIVYTTHNAKRALKVTLANNVDPDQTPQNASFDHTLHLNFCINCKKICKVIKIMKHPLELENDLSKQQDRRIH